MQTLFGQYQLLELLGRGGMGEVYRAHDTATDRIVALKLLPAHLADDPQYQERFRREARTAAGLTDPHVVPIHNYGEIDGRLYVDMRLVEGRDLGALITENSGRLDPARTVAIIEQIAAALDNAHRAQLVHRDIKPSNILVTQQDFAYLIDFGIARAANDTVMTNTGQTIGTIAYMAPERFNGITDPRSDIYALTCVLYECLTGQHPYPGDTLEQQLAGHLNNPPPQPSTAGLPPSFDTVIAHGMAKNPDQRFQTATELAAAARGALNTPQPQPTQFTPQHPTAPAPATAPDASSPTIAVATQPFQPHPPLPPPNTSSRTTLGLIVTAAVVVVVAIAATAGYLILRDPKVSPVTQTQVQPIRVVSDKVITEPGSDNPKAVMSVYEDFLCPACGMFERTFGATLSRLIDTGAVAVDYVPVAILDGVGGDRYSSRAGAAAYCVADESVDAFRRFHTALFTPELQPSELSRSFPDNARLIELARQAGVVGGVANCINNDTFVAMVQAAANVTGIRGTPTLKINGVDYRVSTPEALIDKIKQIVGDVPGL